MLYEAAQESDCHSGYLNTGDIGAAGNIKTNIFFITVSLIFFIILSTLILIPKAGVIPTYILEYRWKLKS